MGLLVSMLYHRMDAQALGIWQMLEMTTTGSEWVCREGTRPRGWDVSPSHHLSSVLHPSQPPQPRDIQQRGSQLGGASWWICLLGFTSERAEGAPSCSFCYWGTGWLKPKAHLQVDLQPLVVHLCLEGDEVQLLGHDQRGLGGRRTR